MYVYSKEHYIDEEGKEHSWEHIPMKFPTEYRAIEHIQDALKYLAEKTIEENDYNSMSAFSDSENKKWNFRKTTNRTFSEIEFWLKEE